uniref:Uncharacterized protein n=1 Tax=Biomphalaria glabrata TaxID=6526 RepID=A0A2C9M5K6_BIOGL
MELAASLVPEILKKTSEKESTISATMKTQLMYFVNSPSGRKAASLFLNEMIELFLETEDRQILTVITSVYPSNPKAFEDHFRFCMEKMIKSRDVNLVNSLAYLLQEVSKKQAKLFTSEDIQMLFEKAQRNTNWQVCVLLILQELAKRCPEKMIDHISFLLDRSAWPSHVAVYFITDIMKTLALFQKDVASSIVGAIFLYLKSTQEKQEQLPLFSALDAICFKYPGLLNRQDVEAISPTDPDVVRQKHTLLNIIDGKTPNDLAEKLKKHEEDLDELVGRVDETEEFVNEVKEEVTQQSEQLGQVKHDVKEQGKKLSTVKLDEPDIKVEGFDPMTLVQSPFSTRDLTQLLNTNQKLQSSQLGYNNEAFRGLAHAGMASLDRWDTTRQTSEAALNASTLHLEMDMPDVNAMMDYAMRNAATAYSKWLSPSCEEFTLNKRETLSHGFQTDLFKKDESVPKTSYVQEFDDLLNQMQHIQNKMSTCDIVTPESHSRQSSSDVTKPDRKAATSTAHNE